MHRVKGPILRGWTARAPYSQRNGLKDLTELVIYHQRFRMNLTDEEKQQLIAFLNSP
jgi:hypothetical protein